MRKFVKKIIILILCVAMLMGDNSVSSYASMVEEENTESDSSNKIDIINEKEVEEYFATEDISDTEIEEDILDEKFEESVEEIVSESLAGATYSLKYTLSGTKATITGYDGELTGELEIPQYIDGYQVYSIGENAFEKCTKITSLKIANTVKIIEKNAFYGCISIKGELVLPSKLEKLGQTSFAACRNISGSIHVPGTVKKIEGGAFQACYGITGLIIDEGVEGIDTQAFKDCQNLEGNLVLPSTVRMIGHNTFENCFRLTGELVIPESCSIIGKAAFMECRGFSGLKLPYRDLYIYEYAFLNCDGMSGQLVLPSDIEYINQGVFMNCSFGGELVIPSTVTYIYGSAFANSSYSDVFVPSSVTYLGEGAFNEISEGIYGLIPATYHCVKNSYAYEWFSAQGGDVVEWNDNELPTEDIDENGFIKFGNIRWKFEQATLHIKGEGKLIDLITNNGNENSTISVPWHKYKNDIERIILYDGLSSVGNNQFMNYSKVKRIDFSNTIKEIGEGAFSGCDSLESIEYNGYETQYNNTIGNSIDSLIKCQLASVHFTRDEYTKGYFQYVNSMENLSESTYSFEYSDDIFSTINTKYDHELAKLSLKTEMAAFGVTDVEHRGGIGTIEGRLQYENIKEMMGAMRFENPQFHYPDWNISNPNTIGYAIAHKEVDVNEGGSASVILVAVRGAGYGTEWGGNFNVGNSLNHKGFEVAADQVYKGVCEYINDNKQSLQDRKKLWIVGYSRGGAVANLVTARIYTGWYPGIDIDKYDIYTYTFEAPCNTTIEEQLKLSDRELLSSRCNNIYNIANPVDFVPYVAPANWGFSKYGENYYFPSPQNYNSQQYEALYEKMVVKYSEITGLEINESKEITRVPANIQMAWKELVDFLCDIVPTQEEFSRGQDNLIPIIAKMLSGYEFSKVDKLNRFCAIINAIIDIKYEELGLTKLALRITMSCIPVYNKATFMYESFNNVSSLITDVPSYLKTKKDILNNLNEVGETIKKNHFPELCLAWMETLEHKEVTSPKPFSLYKSNCHADICVYDENNLMVAQIKNDELVYVKAGIPVYVDSDGQKNVAIPGTGKYHTEIMAHENGELTYSVEHYTENMMEPNRIESYLNLPIMRNDVYRVETNNDDVMVQNPERIVLNPDYSAQCDDIEYMFVEISCSGAGYTMGGGNHYHIGEFAKVTAIPYTDESDFKGWYVNNILVSNELEYRFPVKQDTIIEARFEDADGKMHVKGLKDSYTYTGKAITPDFQVYDGMNLLTKNIDYTVSYKNNINVNDASDLIKAPTIIVRGKGNYNQSETLTFKIEAANIAESVFSSDEIAVLTTTKEQKPKPVLKWNGKVVPTSGYTYRYYRADYEGNPEGSEIASVKEAGNYVIVITGKANYSGKRNVKLTLASTQKLVNKLSVVAIPAKAYTGSPIKPELVVKDGKNLLIKDKDYSVKYFNNVSVGTASVVISGIGNYVGSKTVTFKITGIPITRATVDGVKAQVNYTGNEVQFDDIKLYIKATAKTSQINLNKNIDYTVSYVNNKRVGTATVVFMGINGYTGVLKKTFRITQFKLADEPDRIKAELDSDNVIYCKGGAKPKVVVKFTNGDGTESVLTEKSDYTLAYIRNTTVNDCSNERNLPTVKVILRGNFGGSISKYYKIIPKDISIAKAEAVDRVYQNKKNIYATVLSLKDTDGKRLVVNKDYEKSLEYRYVKTTNVLVNGSFVTRNADELVNINDVIPAETDIKVTAFAKEGGNYTGSISTIYRIVKRSIMSAKVTIPKQIYTGSGIYVDGSELNVRIGKDTLENGVDFMIVPGTYENNVNKGNAFVTIRGIGNYGSIKKVTYAIKAKGIQWWWKNKFAISSCKLSYTFFNLAGSIRLTSNFKVNEGEIEKIQFITWTSNGGTDDLKSSIEKEFVVLDDGTVSITTVFYIRDKINKGDFNIRVIAVSKNGEKIEVGNKKINLSSEGSAELFHPVGEITSTQ